MVAVASGLGLLVLAPDAAAREIAVDWSVSLGTGFDTNPMRVADDGPNGAFATVGLYGKLSQRVGRAASWFADARIDHRAFDADTDLADRHASRVRAGWSVRPRARRISFATGASYELDRLTYIDRETATRYTVADGAGQTVDVGDRYDRDVYGLFLNMQYRIGPRLRAVVRSTFGQSRFREDYVATAGLDPLDSSSIAIRPELRFAAHDRLDLAFGIDRTTVDYDDRPALDANGDPVSGVARRYEYTQFVVRMKYEPASRWNLRAGMRLRERADTYAGYYDYAGALGYVAIDRELGERGAMTLSGSHGRTEYDTATVSGTGVDEPRGGDVTRWAARYRHDASDAIQLFAEAGSRSTDDNDPVYAHSRAWVSVGLEFHK